MIFHSGPTLEEISIQKQIRTKLKQCTYERLYKLATYFPKEYKHTRSPFHPLNIIKSILFPSNSGSEAAEEYNARRMRNLAREVIAEKYPNYKQHTQLEDYL